MVKTTLIATRNFPKRKYIKAQLFITPGFIFPPFFVFLFYGFRCHRTVPEEEGTMGTESVQVSVGDTEKGHHDFGGRGDQERAHHSEEGSSER